MDCWSFNMNPSFQWLPSIIGGVRRLVPMREGDVDSDRRGEGDSAIGEESLLLLARDWDPG